MSYEECLRLPWSREREMYYEEYCFCLPWSQEREMHNEERFCLTCLVTIAVVLYFIIHFSRQKGKRRPTAGNRTTTSTEVFLNYRGIDTHKSFSDYLFHSLVDAGVRPFREDNEVREGEVLCRKLLQAIRESEISIPIFSKNYASSKWCLLELAYIVDCHKSMGQRIFPIFFDVQPSDVKNQTGAYEEAFREHLKLFDQNTVQNWRKDLRKVGAMRGWVLEKENNGYQGSTAKDVVKHVALVLKKDY